MPKLQIWNAKLQREKVALWYFYCTGLKTRKPSKKPFLIKKIIKKEHDFSWLRNLQKWSVSDWTPVDFSDESTYLRADGLRLVKTAKGEWLNESCTIKTAKHSPYIMVCEGITFQGLRKVLIIKGPINSKNTRHL